MLRVLLLYHEQLGCQTWTGLAQGRERSRFAFAPCWERGETQTLCTSLPWPSTYTIWHKYLTWNRRHQAPWYLLQTVSMETHNEFNCWVTPWSLQIQGNCSRWVVAIARKNCRANSWAFWPRALPIDLLESNEKEGWERRRASSWGLTQGLNEQAHLLQGNCIWKEVLLMPNDGIGTQPRMNGLGVGFYHAHFRNSEGRRVPEKVEQSS